MNKSLSRALLAAGVVAFAAAAQAGPMTGSGETSMTPTTRGDGQDHSYVYSTPDLAIMGAGPYESSSTTYYVYPQTHLFPQRSDGASSSFNVPGRAGEASTMTNGVPNLQTTNPSPPVSSVVIVPYTVTN